MIVVSLMTLAGCKSSPPEVAAAAPAELPDWFVVADGELRRSFAESPVVSSTPLADVRAVVATYAPSGNTLVAEAEEGTLLLLRREGASVQNEAEWLARALGLTLTVEGERVEAPTLADLASADPVAPALKMTTVRRQFVEDTLRANIQDLMGCFEQAERLPQGLFHTSFVVGPKGNVLDAVAAGTTIGHPVVERCMLSTIEGLTFWDDAQPGRLLVEYPFVFFPSRSPSAMGRPPLRSALADTRALPSLDPRNGDNGTTLRGQGATATLDEQR